MIFDRIKSFVCIFNIFLKTKNQQKLSLPKDPIQFKFKIGKELFLKITIKMYVEDNKFHFFVRSSQMQRYKLVDIDKKKDSRRMFKTVTHCTN